MDRAFFDNQIAASRITRRASIQVTVPTFESYDVTKKTIERLFAQDVAFSTKVLSCARIRCAGDVMYYHEKYQIKVLTAAYQYFHVRGLAILTFLESCVALRYRVRHALNLVFMFFISILRTIQFHDALYLHIFFRALGDGLFRNRTFQFPTLPKEKFQFVEVDAAEAKDHAVLISVRNALWLKRYYQYPMYFAKRTAYFKRAPNSSYPSV